MIGDAVSLLELKLTIIHSEHHKMSNRILYRLFRASILVLLSSFLLQTHMWAQQREKQSIKEYVEAYKGIAVLEMQRSNIPASITLAQGILESQSGNSYLVRKANNHFGIKCHRSWNGAKIHARDDKQRDCFRKYPNDYASFIDHTNFLTGNSRYSFLFDGQQVDYKTWANGLKKAGYATDQQYARHLIYLIEKYQLNQFDLFLKEGDCGEMILAMTAKHNGIKTVMFNCYINPDYVAETYAIPIEQLRRYNQLDQDDLIEPNTMVFLEPPRQYSSWANHAPRPATGTSMYQLASQYGFNEHETPSKLTKEEVRQQQQKFVAQRERIQKTPVPIESHNSFSQGQTLYAATTRQHQQQNTVRSQWARPDETTEQMAARHKKEQYEAQQRYLASQQSRDPRYTLMSTAIYPQPNFNRQNIEQQQTGYPNYPIYNQVPHTNNKQDYLAKHQKNTTIYQVQEGDTLYSLAKKFSTSITSIKSKNGLGSNVIRVGQSLKIDKG